MRHLLLATLSALSVFAGLPASGQVSPLAAPAAVPAGATAPLFDLSKVEGLDKYTGPEEGKALLAQRGLLVSPETEQQLFDFYSGSLPYFITTDAALHTYRVILEKEFKEFEKRQAGALSMFQQRAWVLLAEGRESDKVTSRIQWPEGPQARAATMAAVGCRLLAPDWKPPTEAGLKLYAKIAADVGAELKRIAAGQATASPLFGLTVDYSLFTPRGFYADDPALERFFRARQFWAAPMNLDDDGTFQAAIAWAVLCDDYGYQVQMAAPYQQLLGPDNLPSALRILTLRGLAGDGRSVGALAGGDGQVTGLLEGRGLPEARRELRAVLPPPLVPVGADMQQVMAGAQADAAKRPLVAAVWPQLALPDAAMMARCVWPNVPELRLPGGLDVLAACGNDRALELLLAGANAANRKPLEAAVHDTRTKRHRLLRRFETPQDKPRDLWGKPLGNQEVSGRVEWTDAEHGAMWAGMEQVFAALGDAGLTARHPRFMTTTAYADKSINTALAGWSGYRHTFVLHSPPMGVFGSMSIQPSGYVEPNLRFWAAMDDLAMRTCTWLHARGGEPRGMLAFVELCKRARAIAEKQLAGYPLSPQDDTWIKGYGERMAGLCGYNIDFGDDRDESGIVVDIATDRLLNRVVYVGTGRPRAIYVIMDYGGRLQLARGGVLSYREFTRPLVERRLTDDRWRQMLAAGQEPAPPAWLASLGVDYTQDGLVAAIKDGRVNAAVLDRHVSREIAAALLESCVAHSPGKTDADRTAVMLAWHLAGLMDRHSEVIDLPLVEGYVEWAEKYPWGIEALPRKAEFVDYYVSLADRWSKAAETQELWRAVGKALARTDAPAARTWLTKVFAAGPGEPPRAMALDLAMLGRDKLPDATIEAVTDYLLADLDPLSVRTPANADLHNVRSRLMALWPYWALPHGKWELSPAVKPEPVKYPDRFAPVRARVVGGLKRMADRTAGNESLWGSEDVEALAHCLGPEVLQTSLAERVRKLSWARRYAGLPDEPPVRHAP